MGTLTNVLSVWGSYKQKGKEYIGNCPWKQGGDSNSFCLTAEDEEHGGWIYFAGGESGSLYDMAQRLGVPLPTHGNLPATETKRLYTGLADYAAAHGVSAAVFEAAGWSEGKWFEHPALIFQTTTGLRYRLLDVTKGVYRSQDEYQRCWYGWKYLSTIDKDVIVLCNGEPSTVVAQHFGVPALCVTSGEKAIPDNLIAELRSKWTGAIWIALDCDEAGRTAAKTIEAQLKGAGYQDVHVLDMGLTSGGDLADYCRLHGKDAFSALRALLPRTQAMDSHAVAKQAVARLDDVIVGQPITLPFRQFHALGGFAKVVMPGKLVGVAAPSSHGKTAWLETLSDMLMKRGENGLYEGKEWLPEEYHARRIQRMGGITYEQWMDYELYKSEKVRGIPDSMNAGHQLSWDDEKKFVSLSNEVTTWRGKLNYVKQHIYLEDTLADMDEQIASARRNGQPISFAVFDYVNVYKVKSTGTDRTSNTTEYIIGLIKDWTIRHSIVSFAGIQITKDASEGNKRNKLLGAEDIMFARDWQFNLLMTLNIVHREDMTVGNRNPDGTPKWVRTPYAIANVVKNSSGRIGETRLRTDFSKLSWLDEGWEWTHVDLGKDEDEYRGETVR